MALGLVLILVACNSNSGAEQTDASLLYKVELDAYLQSANTSEWAKQVFSDYWVSDQEMNEAIERYTICIEQEGLRLDGDYSLTEGYTLHFPHAASRDEKEYERLNEYEQKCEKDNIGLIDFYYKHMRFNPHKEDLGQAVFDCALRVGIIDPNMDRETYDSTGWQEASSQHPEDFQRCNDNPFGIEDLPWG